jgi:phage terminase small subunit
MAETVVKSKLTERQERFCIEYVLNKGNATEAAARAGYSDSSESVLANAGFDNLRNPEIIARIAQLREDTGVKTGANIEWMTSVLVSTIENAQADRDSKGVAMNAAVLMKLMGWEGAVTAIPLEKIADKLAEQWKEMRKA